MPPEVKTYTINPKSVASTQLFGSFDPNTHEWTDGVLAIIYRDVSKDLCGNSNWLVFDGPVDTLWIESMNTVLDDNKSFVLYLGKLSKWVTTCAWSSNRLILKKRPRQLYLVLVLYSWSQSSWELSASLIHGFETLMVDIFHSLEKLEAATARHEQGWRYRRVKRFTQRISEWISKSSPKSSPRGKKGVKQSDILQGILDWLLKPAMFFIYEYCNLMGGVTKMEMTNNSLTLLKCLMIESFEGEDTKMPSDRDMPRFLENLAIHSIAWSVGAQTNTQVGSASMNCSDCFWQGLSKRVHQVSGHFSWRKPRTTRAVHSRTAKLLIKCQIQDWSMTTRSTLKRKMETLD